MSTNDDIFPAEVTLVVKLIYMILFEKKEYIFYLNYLND